MFFKLASFASMGISWPPLMSTSTAFDVGTMTS